MFFGVCSFKYKKQTKQNKEPAHIISHHDNVLTVTIKNTICGRLVPKAVMNTVWFVLKRFAYRDN